MKSSKTLQIGCAIGALVAVSAQAQDHQAGFFINPQVGAYFFDSKRNLDDDYFVGLGLGYQFANPWAVEFNYLTGSADPSVGGGDVDFDQFRLDGLYHFSRNGSWQPYAAAGIGQGYFESSVSEDTETFINVGGGVKYFFTDAVSLRGDARLINGFDDDTQDVALTLGLNILFGAKSAPTPKPAPVAAAPVAPTPVAAAPKDSDGDGVIDSNDACPDTAAGARVDARGCYVMLTETVSIELKINFANNSSEIAPEFMSEIKKVADFMREYPQTDVVVEGHTDDRGAAAYNQQLSDSRAKAVASALVSNFGVNAARVSSVGKGEENPIADNTTAEGRAANRRVVGVINAQLEKRANN